ncbi:MAG TPA: hypothetical protein VH040_09915 [Usitatibacter sp.]|jgi:hypothetical protein|nr:hypothetical protein [Usitatibacter sp.]
MKRFAAAVLFLSSLSTASAFAQEKQFDFLLGQWEVDVRPKVSGIAAAIHGTPKLTGTWKAWRAMDGLAIEDELRIVDTSGNPISLSHGMRIYSKADHRWRAGLLDAYRARFSESSGEAGTDVVMSGRGVDPEGRPVMSRVRYLDIGPNGFRMQQDRSSDEGKTWDEAVLTIVAKRTGAAAPR